MYPTGGYGNFLYCLLSEHLESTVKLESGNWEFLYGNSHGYPKHAESFMLGLATLEGRLKNFTYTYKLRNEAVAEQIQQGKKFLVLADVGNKGDNINFLRRYFPNATIIRVFAETFTEKLIVWTNCMIKRTEQVRESLYPGSILPKQGIATWANKNENDVTDSDAVDCMVNFFQNDFDIYGKMFSEPTPGVINIPLKSFFTTLDILQMVHNIAEQLDTVCVNQQGLEQLVSDFINQQLPLSLLEHGDTFPLVRTALAKYEQ